MVIKLAGYRLRNGSKLLDRDPVFLIRADLTLAIETLLQAYMDRWQIEFNHRDEKSKPGVARPPQFQVAGYSLLLLASLIAFGFQRTAEFPPLPKWRGKFIRPSVLDILNLLRQQIFSRQLQPMPGHENSLGHFVNVHPCRVLLGTRPHSVLAASSSLRS